MELIVKDRNGDISIAEAEPIRNCKTISITQELDGMPDVILVDTKSIDKLIEALNKIKNIL